MKTKTETAKKAKRATKARHAPSNFAHLDTIDQNVARIGNGLKVLAMLGQDMDEPETRPHAEVAYYLVAMAHGLWGAAQVALILYLDAFTAAAEVLTECGGSTGHAYVFASPLITPGTEGWTEDRLSGGRILLTIDQGEADIIYRDVTGMRSAKGDGAEIMIAGGSADQGTTLVLLFYPTHGIVEHYLFQIDSTGKGAVSWATPNPAVQLSGILCSPPSVPRRERVLELMRPVILATFGEILRAGYRLDVLRDDCRRAVRLEAAALPLDRSYLGARFRCACGSRCRPIVSKPQPEARP